MTQTEIILDNAQVICYNKFCTVWHDIVVPASFKCAKLHDEKMCLWRLPVYYSDSMKIFFLFFIAIGYVTHSLIKAKGVVTFIIFHWMFAELFLFQ